MKKYFCLLTACLAFLCSKSQIVLTVPQPEFLPNNTDSNNLYVYGSLSYIYPVYETTDFQRKTLYKDHQRGNRFQKGEMEFLFFTSFKYENRFEPYVFFRTEAFPMAYLSLKFGAGMVDRKTNSGIGFSYGNYLKNVPYESNFITRRGRSFENYPLYGVHAHSSSSFASFFLSLARERNRVFYSARCALRVGSIFSLGQTRESLFRKAEAVLELETLTGYNVGLSVMPMKNFQLSLLWSNPIKEDQEEQARLRNKLSRGALFRISFCVN